MPLGLALCAFTSAIPTTPLVNAAGDVVVSVPAPAVSADSAPSPYSAPSWLSQFQDSLKAEAERQLKEAEEMEKQRVTFELEMDQKRKQFELDLEKERKQFEKDMKQEQEKKDAAANEKSDLKYFISLGVTLSLFSLDQFYFKKKGESPTKVKGKNEESFLD